MLTHLSLFSGIGGLDLAAEWAGIQTVGQCEWAEYPTKILEKYWPQVPRWRDIKTLTGDDFYAKTGRRTVDIISGGFPCQPFSVAGKQRGKEDDRYLWPEMVRVIKELRPTWVVGENVTGIIRLALPDILSELESCGYRARVFHISASGVGARHHRYRVAIVANSESQFEGRLPVREEQEKPRPGISCENVQHTDGTGCKEQHIATESDKEGFTGWRCDARTPPFFSYSDNRSGDVRRNREFQTASETKRQWNNFGGRAKEYEPREWRPAKSVLGGVVDGIPNGVDGDLDFIINHYWDEEPDIPKIANGIEHRVDRLKCLGNAVVPQQFYPIFSAIAQIEEMNE